ncbi:hypothetical protein ACWGR4_10410 [Embleya sp. NPDC055664]
MIDEFSRVEAIKGRLAANVLTAVKPRRAVWALTSASLFAAADTGRDLAELRRYLDDAARRAGQVRDTGPVHLIECADPAVAALLATDRPTRAHCTRLGERHLAVPLDKLPAFRKSALAQGYPAG